MNDRSSSFELCDCDHGFTWFAIGFLITVGSELRGQYHGDSISGYLQVGSPCLLLSDWPRIFKIEGKKLTGQGDHEEIAVSCETMCKPARGIYGLQRALLLISEAHWSPGCLLLTLACLGDHIQCPSGDFYCKLMHPSELDMFR